MSDYRSPLEVFVGYDPGEIPAFMVCVSSLIKHASQPLKIVPLALNTIAPVYGERHEEGSTTFAFSRFLAPYLSGNVGMSLYLDGDMLIKDDIAKLFDESSRDFNPAVWVVKHPEYTPRAKTKFRGAAQHAYPRKNWSSVMLFRNGSSYCKRLTPEYVAKSTGAHLHQFEWCPDDRIGELSPGWNHLVGETAANAGAYIHHYTEGIPLFKGFEHCDHADEWFNEFDRITHVDDD